MVFQDPFGSLNPVHKVRTHIMRPLIRLRPELLDTESRERVLHELLSSVELTPTREFVDRFPDSMSGGQRQRVSIARALAASPTFLIADEPTSMLDVSIREQVLKLFLKLRDQGLGIVLITHDLSSVVAIADHLHVLKGGVCVESGTTSEVIGNPQHPYTQRLLAAVPDPLGHFLRAATPVQQRLKKGTNTQDDERSIS